MWTRVWENMQIHSKHWWIADSSLWICEERKQNREKGFDCLFALWQLQAATTHKCTQTPKHSKSIVEQRRTEKKEEWKEGKCQKNNFLQCATFVCVCVSDRHKVWACLCKVAFTSVEVVFSGGGGVKTGLYTRSQRTRNHNPSSSWIIHENIPFYILPTDMGVYMLWLSKVTMKNKPRHQTQREKENSQASKNSTAHNLVLSTSLNLHGFTAKEKQPIT